MPANSLNAASADWSAEPVSNMRSLPLSTRGSTWLFHIFITDAILRLVAFFPHFSALSLASVVIFF